MASDQHHHAGHRHGPRPPPAEVPGLVTDPVCGMRIKPEIPAGMEEIIARKVAEQLAAMGHARAA